MPTTRLAAVPSLAQSRSHLPTKADLDLVRQRPHVEEGDAGCCRWPWACGDAGAGYAGDDVRPKALNPPPAPLAWNVSFSLLVIGLFAARGFYAPRLRPHLLDDIRLITSATPVATMVPSRSAWT